MHGASAKVIPKVNYTHLCKIDFRGVTRDLKARGNLCTTPVKICANGGLRSTQFVKLTRGGERERDLPWPPRVAN